jgi:hypothetical protein
VADSGRNDPCHCGSGKKYKKCHLEQDEARKRQSRQLETVSAWLGYHAAAVFAQAERVLEASGARAAALETFGPVSGADEVHFRSFATCDFPLDALGRVAVSRPTDPDGVTVAPAPRGDEEGDQDALRDVLAKSHLSVHEVTECKRGKGVGLRDVFTGAEDFVWDDALGDALEPMEYVLGRKVQFTERPLLMPGWEKLRFHVRKRVVQALRADFEAALDQEEAGQRLPRLKALAPALVKGVRALELPLQPAHE